MELTDIIKKYKQVVDELLSTQKKIIDSLETRCAELDGRVIKLETELKSGLISRHEVVGMLRRIKKTAHSSPGWYWVPFDALTKERRLIDPAWNGDWKL